MELITSQYYYGLLVVFIILAYLIVTDNSIATYIVLLQKLLKSKYELFKWWLLNNPQNPIVKYLIWRRSMKLAEELQKEFNNIEKNTKK